MHGPVIHGGRVTGLHGMLSQIHVYARRSYFFRFFPCP
jgi:hypothetical protein